MNLKAFLTNVKLKQIAFYVSALAFLCLQCSVRFVPFAFLIIVLMTFKTTILFAPQSRTFVPGGGIPSRLFLALTTVGIGLCAIEGFKFRLSYINVTPGIRAMAVLAAFVSGFFVYCVLSLFFYALQKNIQPGKLIRSLTKREKAVYGIFLALAFALIAYAFSFSDFSCYTDVYSSDGWYLFTSNNAFLFFYNHENDLRQPLFAMFSAPFNGAAYAVARLFPGVPALMPILMNWAQYLMVFAANLLLAHIMNLNERERMGLLCLTFLAYPYLFFGLIVEQYMVVYFYLILAFYVLSERRECNPLVFCGVSGTLLTGLVLAPLFSDASPLRNFKKWLLDMCCLALSFAALFVVSGKLSYIFDLSSTVNLLHRFARGVSFQERLLQYVNFISSCLVSPTDVTFTESTFGLKPVTHLNLFGLFVFILICVSFAVNRKDKVCRYAFGWIAFSFLILCVIGWGSVENIMPLYGLYFSWAFIVLLYRLFQKIAEKLRRDWILYACCAVMGAFLLYRNTEGLRLLMSYFAQFTPRNVLEAGV